MHQLSYIQNGAQTDKKGGQFIMQKEKQKTYNKTTTEHLTLEWHAEGGLWFEGKNVIDYDGVFALAGGVIELLNENGYSTDEVGEG